MAIPLRTVKSYMIRQGRMTPGQKRAYAELFARFGIEAAALKDVSKLFPQPAPLWLEIGFGMGQTLLHYAKTQPKHNFIGIEVHVPGIGAVLNAIAADTLQNVRIVNADAVVVLKECLPKASLSGVNIFFPDPWPKKRHHKRRLIQSEFIKLLAEKLVPGGLLHLATDWQEYAEHMLAVLRASPYFENTTADYADRGERPLTKFEQKGLAQGHAVFDLRFIRTDIPIVLENTEIIIEKAQ